MEFELQYNDNNYKKQQISFYQKDFKSQQLELF